MFTSNNIPNGLKVPSSIPLDSELWAKSRSNISSLGDSNHLAFSYYKGMRIYVADQKEIYEWMPVSEANLMSLTALLPSNFTYPNNYIVNEVDYSNIAYNLFLIPQAWDIVVPDIPDVISIGGGTKIYKGKNTITGNHEIRTVSSTVVPISPVDNQLTGNVTLSTSVLNESVLFTLDLSNLKVPLTKTDGIPEFYVHSAADASIADGSVVRPFKTWEDCKSAIINSAQGGTFWNPHIQNARVIFQTSLTISESLTVNKITYNFENNSILTYTGTDYAVCDMQLIVNAIPDNPDLTKTINGYINFEGFGEITRNINSSGHVIFRAVGYGVSSITTQNSFTIRVTSGIIVVSEKSYNQTNFENTNKTDGAGKDVWALSKVGGVDKIPAVDGLVVVKGRNYQVRDSFYVNDGAILKIRHSIQRPIYIEDNGGFINYGKILFEAKSAFLSNFGVRYGEIYPSDRPGVTFNIKYSPSYDVSMILIKGGGGFSTSSTGSISSYLLGSVKEGGYNSFVELEGANSSFQVSGLGSLSANTFTRYNHLFYFKDFGINRNISISNIFTVAEPNISIIGSNVSLKDENCSLGISEGMVESNNSNGSTTQIFNSTVEGLNFVARNLVVVAGKLTTNTTTVKDFADSTAAKASGLINGMIFRTGENLKIVL